MLVCDPDDLVQETIKRLLENDRQRLRSFDEPKSCLKTWLTRVALNHILNLQRQQGCLLQLEEPFLTGYTTQPEQETPLFEQERAEMFLWARNRLSESQQFILDRCSRDDFDARAVAKELGISRDRLYGRKRKMIHRFQELLREYGKRKRGT